jgi:hypothetical protein
MLTKTKEKSSLDREIERVLRDLMRHEIGSEEYVKSLDCLSKLTSLQPDKGQAVSRDTLVSVGANLLGIFMIIKHENVNVITSKALNFVTRTK